MKTRVFFFISIILLGCKRQESVYSVKTETKKSTSKSDNIKQSKISKKAEISKSKIMGIWTDGSTENATFEIKSKSLYYVDDFKDYSYELKKDTIQINYPDYIYRAEILLRNDTLIMNSKEYKQTKYWRFKE
jgi:hypothetical protein